MSLGITELMEEQKRLREEEPSLYGGSITGEPVQRAMTPEQVREEILQLPPPGFLGIDVGIRKRTSWALVSKAGELIAVGDVAVDAKKKNDRYAALALDLDVLPWVSTEIVGVEWPWVGPNKYAAQAIAMATGVVVAVGARHGKYVMFIDPSKAKVALTGDYLATAIKMQREAELKYGREFHTDQASAIGIALAVRERRR